MKKMNDFELDQIKGGDSLVSGPIINAIVGVIRLIQEAGYNLGSGFRRISDDELCPLK
ncbi:MAG: bacteriocin [Bacilli bacterium]|nr:bacteriocin [Bacilli bacterium]